MVPKVDQNEQVNSTQFPEKYYDDPLGMDRYVVQEKVLFEWKAPNKIEKKRTRSEMVQIVLGVVLVALILFLVGDILPVIVFCAAAFALIAFMMSKPTFLTCRVTTIGIKVDDQYHYWPEITQFWFETRSGTRLLYLRSLRSNFSALRFIINPNDEEEIKTTIGKYLLYKKPYQTWFDKLVDNLRNRLPLNFDLF